MPTGSQFMDDVIRSKTAASGAAAALDIEELQDRTLELQQGMIDHLEVLQDLADTVDKLPESSEKDRLTDRLDDAINTFWHDVVRPYDEIETLAGIDDTELEPGEGSLEDEEA